LILNPENLYIIWACTRVVAAAGAAAFVMLDFSAYSPAE